MIRRNPISKEQQRINERLKAEAWDLAMAYKSFFQSENGKLIWADLKKRFGWLVQLWQPGMVPGEVEHEIGQQSVLLYINREIEKPLSEEDKPPEEARHG